MIVRISRQKNKRLETRAEWRASPDKSRTRLRASSTVRRYSTVGARWMSLVLDALLLGTAAIHVLLTPFTKVEESFSLHGVHDVLAYGVGPNQLTNVRKMFFLYKALRWRYLPICYQYDHFVFSGAVPRSFIGNVLLAWMSLPVLRLGSILGVVETKKDILLTGMTTSVLYKSQERANKPSLVRLTLALINAFGLCTLRRSVSRRFGSSTGFFFAIITCTQFHLPFWMGRTLPNMFALFPGTWCSNWYSKLTYPVW